MCLCNEDTQETYNKVIKGETAGLCDYCIGKLLVQLSSTEQ